MSNPSATIKRIPGAVRGRVAARRHTALLAAIVAAFTVRPLIGDFGLAPVLFSVSMLALVVVALYTIRVDELVGERERLIRERRRWLAVGWFLGTVAVAERIIVFAAPSRTISIVGAGCWVLLFAFITWQELNAVLRQKRVTGETISMAISGYLLLGFTWGMLYILFYQIQPGAFSFGGSSAPAGDASLGHQSVFPVLLYYSLTTLSTIGFGDIVPVTLQVRYLSVAEGITGQFYLAILVARLVGMQMSQSAAHAEPSRKDH